jgi:hypothetical protein
MFRVLGAAPPPGPAREQLHMRALGETRLDASIKVLGALHEALPSDGRRRDLKEALESALKVSKRWSKRSAERKWWTELAKGLA